MPKNANVICEGSLTVLKQICSFVFWKNLRIQKVLWKLSDLQKIRTLTGKSSQIFHNIFFSIFSTFFLYPLLDLQVTWPFLPKIPRGGYFSCIHGWIYKLHSPFYRKPPAWGSPVGVSGQFPPGHHCWSTRYKTSFYLKY